MDDKPRVPEFERRTVLKKVPSGEIALELGADGVYLRFDCDCLDALPYCKSVCCTLSEISVSKKEAKRLEQKYGDRALPIIVENRDQDSGLPYEMTRRSDGYCACNEDKTKLCGIYPDRPATCSEFHCTRAAGMRGWRLDLVRLDE